MAALPDNTRSTVYQINRHWEETQDRGNRPHLGASQIGHPCSRRLWYGFRWAIKHAHSGRLLRLVDRGQEEEARFVRDLRAIGATVHDRDPRTGKQFRFVDVAGHFGGSCDAVVRDIPESTREHVCEMKTHNDKSFQDLCKNGVEKSKPEHWHQMQLYMHWSGCKRALYLAVNKNDDSLYAERIRYDKAAAEADIEKARMIVQAATPPARLSEDPTLYLCKWCDFKGICHEGEAAEANCRTCINSTPEINGDARWTCAKYKADVDVDTQRQGGECPSHLMIPDLVPFAEAVDANEAEGWIEYHAGNGVVFRNGPKGKNSYLSRELRGLPAKLVGNETIETFRAFFDAEVATK
jgi:hypothetical protein